MNFECILKIAMIRMNVLPTQGFKNLNGPWPVNSNYSNDNMVSKKKTMKVRFGHI